MKKKTIIALCALSATAIASTITYLKVTNSKLTFNQRYISIGSDCKSEDRPADDTPPL